MYVQVEISFSRIKYKGRGRQSDKNKGGVTSVGLLRNQNLGSRRTPTERRDTDAGKILSPARFGESGAVRLKLHAGIEKVKKPLSVLNNLE